MRSPCKLIQILSHVKEVLQRPLHGGFHEEGDIWGQEVMHRSICMVWETVNVVVSQNPMIYHQE